MKIWILNHYASTPDQPMTGAYYLARSLVRQGQSVRFFASSYSYYKRKELRLSGLKLTGDESFDGIDFTWVRTLPHRASMLTRLINMLSYMFMVLMAGLGRGKPDVIIGTCPHLFGALSAMLLAKWKRSPFVYEVRDLWPQTFVDSGALSANGLLTRVLRRVEQLLYHQADLIVTVLPFVNDYLRQSGVDTSKWLYVPNGVDSAEFPELAPPTRNADGSLTFMYLGGHARYQGLDTILRAAELLQNEGITQAKFVLVGDGVEKKNLIRWASDHQLRNVEFRDAVPRSKVPDQLQQAGVAIFHILPLPVLRFGVSPNKLCDYMIAGRPVLCAGDLRNNAIKDSDGGICIGPEDANAMAQSVKAFLAMDSTTLQKHGANSRQYALANWDCRVLAKKLEERLLRLPALQAKTAIRQNSQITLATNESQTIQPSHATSERVGGNFLEPGFMSVNPEKSMRQPLLEMFESMVLVRKFEECVADRVEAGEIATPCHFCIGQEAAAVGVCYGLRQSDTVWGAHRSHGHYLAKGGDLKRLMAEIFCRKTGCSGGRGGSMHVIDTAAGVMGTVPIVAATIPIAVGAGLAAKLQGKGNVAVSFFGDGATEEGHFHESLNLAGVQNLPVLFVCENNLYSSHMGLFQRRREDNIIESAKAHGIAGYRVDGNDVAAVWQTTLTAAEHARNGQGPALLELRTFRWRGHVGPRWDEDVGVKRKGELKEWLPKDPLAATRRQLESLGVSATELQQIEQRVQTRIDEALHFALESPYPESGSVQENVYRMVG